MLNTLGFAKKLIGRAANGLGYRIERVLELGDARLDLFDLLIRPLATIRGDRFFFLQIGANDGISDDPIRDYVTCYHWRGILVEPQPLVFERLKRNYSGEPQLVFENVAIAEKPGTMAMYCPSADDPEKANSCLATFDRESLRRRLGAGTPIIELQVQALDLASLLSRHAVRAIDLLLIDTEGFDFEVIKMMEGPGIWPTILRFEHLLLSQSERASCFAQLAARGYSLHRQEIDVIALRKDAYLDMLGCHAAG